MTRPPMAATIVAFNGGSEMPKKLSPPVHAVKTFDFKTAVQFDQEFNAWKHQVEVQGHGSLQVVEKDQIFENGTTKAIQLWYYLLPRPVALASRGFIRNLLTGGRHR